MIIVPSLLLLLVYLVQLQCFGFVLSYFVKKEKQSWSVESVPQLVFVLVCTVQSEAQHSGTKVRKMWMNRQAGWGRPLLKQYFQACKPEDLVQNAGSLEAQSQLWKK